MPLGLPHYSPCPRPDGPTAGVLFPTTDMQAQGSRFPSLNGRPRFVHWGLLLALTIVFSLLFDTVRMPAALLLGAMLGAILVAITDGTPRIPRRAFVVAQGVIGCLVTRSITPEIIVSLRHDWLIFLSVTLTVILVCAGMGWVLARKQLLPGTTAIWACSPGGASVMTLMSDAYGGDMRLVAVMQYLRVIIVTVLATVVAHVWMGGSHDSHSLFANWLAPVAWLDLGGTLLLATAGSLIAQRLGIPGGALLGPMIIGATLQANGLMRIVLPTWILAPTYVALGWTIGLRFSRHTLSQAARALPSMMISIVCLVLACAGIAVVVAHLTHLDPLTAYLATSPGGLDSVAVIAASSSVNVPFVMAFQTARFLMVVLTGPALAKYMARRLQEGNKA